MNSYNNYMNYVEPPAQKKAILYKKTPTKIGIHEVYDTRGNRDLIGEDGSRHYGTKRHSSSHDYPESQEECRTSPSVWPICKRHQY